MMPANTVASIQRYFLKGEISNGSISKESTGFEPWLDPLTERRISLFQTQGVNIISKISTRLKSLLTAHVFHPALVMYNVNTENEEIWFKDMEPSGITVECLLLRSKNEPENESVSFLDPKRADINYIHEFESNNKDLEFTGLNRNTIIKEVMGTYTSLCAFDPYLNVMFII